MTCPFGKFVHPWQNLCISSDQAHIISNTAIDNAYRSSEKYNIISANVRENVSSYAVFAHTFIDLETSEQLSFIINLL